MKDKDSNSGGFNISEVAIKRPVFTVMMIVTLIVLGLISYSRLNVELFPNVSFPVVVINTTYPGASSKEIEMLVSKPIEDSISSINGIEHIRSISSTGLSTVIAEFKLEKDMKDASNEVREKVALVRPTLPDDVKEPTIARVDPDAAPIINYVIGGNYPIQKLTEYVKDYIKPKLEQVDGVANISIVGGLEKEIQVNLKPSLLKKYGLTPFQINDRLKQENLNFPSGSIKTGTYEITLRTTNAFKNFEDVANVPIKIAGGSTILLKDVADVVDGVKEIRSKAWLNGKPALVLSIQKQSGGNTIKVVENIAKAVNKLKLTMPKGINVGVSFDTSVFIRQSKDAAIDELVVGSILAIIVIFVFLRTVGGTIIAATAIPSSVISAFTMMYVMNFSLNMMSLLALSLVVGILVDDAVVDLENIYRRIEMGENPYDAAIKATNEITLAVAATTFSIVAVFVPIGFMSGIVGQFFKQFGLTVSVAVLISLLVARTLTPTLAAHFLRPLKNSHSEEIRGIAVTYKSILTWALKHRIVTVILTIVVFIGGIMITALVPKGFVPKNDRDEFSIAVQAPSGGTINQTAAILNEIAKRVSTDSDVKETLVLAGSSSGKTDTGSVNVTLRTKKEGRKLSSFDVIENLRKKIQTIPGALMSFKEMRAVDDGSGNYEMNLSLRGENLDELQKVADKVVKLLHSNSKVSDINTSSGTLQTELNIKVDHKKAASLGISAASIASTLRTATVGDTPSQINLANSDIEIRVKMDDETRFDINKLRSLEIPSSSGASVRFDAIADIIFTNGPTKIERYDRQRQIMVYANAIKGVSMGDLIAPIEEELNKMKLEPNVLFSFKGDTERMMDSFNSLLSALLIAVIFIYIILASQFEHFTHPFTIMMAMPLSFVGAFLGLFVANEELGMMSMIGVVMLMGLVTKNSILLVDYTINLRKQGLSRLDALLTAGPIRLRPILMTTVAMIAGMFPIALKLTPGSEGRAPMAVAVIGGLITSTILSLVVIPVFYTIMDDIVSWFAKITNIKVNKPEEFDLKEKNT